MDFVASEEGQAMMGDEAAQFVMDHEDEIKAAAMEAYEHPELQIVIN